MSHKRITVSEVNEKLIRFASKVGLEPDISTRTGNGILSKIQELFSLMAHNKNNLDLLKQEESEKATKKDLVSLRKEIHNLQKQYNKSHKLFFLLMFLAFSALGFLGDKPLEFLKFLFSHGLFP